MRGTLLWFSDTKDQGMLTTEDGDRIPVPGHAFCGDRGEAGRRRGLPVRYELASNGSEPSVASVSLLPSVEPRRARRHSRG